MAVFGVPVLHEDDALRAAPSGVELTRGDRDLNVELERDARRAHRDRTGVNSGEVIAAIPRATNSFVSGDVVVVAERLSAPRRRARSSSARRRTRSRATRFAPSRSSRSIVKGKRDRVMAYRLLEVVAGRSGARAPLRLAMVGRDA